MDETFKGEIPDIPIVDLPPSFNEETERERIADWLVIERVDHQLGFFYKYMNDTASELGLTNTHFAVVHGLPHPKNYSSAYDVAKLIKLALTQYPLLEDICNTKNLYI